MKCPACQYLNEGSDPGDTSCRRCGYEDSEKYQADADEAEDNKRRDKKLREVE